MKVVFITHYGHLYGANRSLLTLLEKAGQFGIEPIVITKEQGRLTEKLEELEIPFHTVEFQSGWHPEPYRGGRWYHQLKQKVESRQREKKRIQHDRELVSSLDLEAIDAVYSNSSVFYFGTLLAKAKKVKHFWHLREVAHLHYRYLPDLGFKHFQKLLQEAHQLIAVSKFVNRQLVPEKMKMSTAVIPNGVFSEEETGNYFQMQRSAFNNIVVVGRLAESKGTLLVIDAFEQLKQTHPELKLKFYGEGDAPFVQQVEQLIVEKQLSASIEIKGFEADVASIYKDADLMFFASENEGMGRVIPEAMAFGVLVMALNSGGSAELIDHGETGFLFEKNIESIVEVFNGITSGKWDLLRIREKAFTWMYDNCTTEIYAQRVFDVITKASNNG